MRQVDYRWVVWTEEHVKEHVQVNKLDPDVKCMSSMLSVACRTGVSFCVLKAKIYFFNFFRAPPQTHDSRFALAWLSPLFA